MRIIREQWTCCFDDVKLLYCKTQQIQASLLSWHCPSPHSIHPSQRVSIQTLNTHGNTCANSSPRLVVDARIAKTWRLDTICDNCGSPLIGGLSTVKTGFTPIMGIFARFRVFWEQSKLHLARHYINRSLLAPTKSLQPKWDFWSAFLHLYSPNETISPLMKSSDGHYRLLLR